MFSMFEFHFIRLAFQIFPDETYVSGRALQIRVLTMQFEKQKNLKFRTLDFCW